MSISGLLTSLALPPLLLVLLAIAGIVLARRRRRFAAGAALLALGVQLALSTPLAAHLLVESLQREVFLSPLPAPPPAAIVVLGGDVAHAADGPQLGPLTLERVRAGAALQRRAGLPLLVTGGRVGTAEIAVGDLMARSLQEEFGVPVRWVERQSRDTWENAALSAAMLHAEGVESAWLVTHVWHMPRSLAVFERRGLRVAAAPVRLERGAEWRLLELVPRADHAAMSWYAIREWVGRAIYRFRA